MDDMTPEEIDSLLTLEDRGRREAERGLRELQWRRFKQHPEEFFQEALWIPSQETDEGKTKFDLYDYQDDDLEKFLTNRFVTVLKSRQIGMSTLVGALAIWRCLFYPGSVVLWISNNQKNADKAIGMIEVMWQSLKPWVKARAPELDADQTSLKEWVFPSGMSSRLRSMAGTATAGASETASIVVLDEFALVDEHIQDSLYRSTEPTTNAGGRLWMLSTARGGHNRFARMFKDAARGENRFEDIFHPWMVSRFLNDKAHLMQGCGECGGTGLLSTDPDEGHTYCPRCVDTSTYEAIQQEYADKPHLMHADYPATPAEAFRESGNPRFSGLIPADEDLFDGWVRGQVVDAAEGVRTFEPRPESHFRLRESYAHLLTPPENDYVLFVDPAKGKGGDYIAAHLLAYDEAGDIEIVGWWHDNMTEPVQVAREVDEIGRWFHNALIAVESTGGWGASMISELNKHLYYPSVYAHRGADKVRKGTGTTYGFPMSWQKRPLVIDRLASLLSNGAIRGIYQTLQRELETFVVTEQGRLEADVGCHDDTVLSLGGGCWVLTERFDPRGKQEDDPDEPRRFRGKLTRLQERVEQARRAKRAADQKFEQKVRRKSFRKKQRSRRRW